MKNGFFFAATLFSLNLYAQKQGQAMLDSLIASVPVSKSDTQQIRLLNKIVLQGIKINPASYLEQYAETGMKLAIKMKWDRAIAVFHNSFGDIYSNEEKRDKAIHEYEMALDIQKKIKDSFNICISQNNIGVVYQHNGNYTKAIEYFTLTVKLAESFNNTYLLALGYANIATVYIDQGNYEKALSYLQQSLLFREKDEDTENIASTVQNIGDVYLRKKDTAKAAFYYNQALNTFQQTENKEGLAQAYGSLAGLSNDSLTKKIQLLLKAQYIWDSTLPRHPNALGNRGSLGESFLLLAQKNPTAIIQNGGSKLTGKNIFLQQASNYLERGIILSKESNGINSYTALNSILSAVEEEKGNYKNALAYFKTFYTLNDSIYSQENKNKLADIESQRTIDVKDKEIAINKLALSNQRKTQIGLIAGIFLLGVIGGLLFWQSRTRKITNTTLLKLNTQLDEANKIKARFFAILSHDLRGPVSSLINFLHLQKEAPDLLSAEQVVSNQQKISNSAESLLETMELMLLWSKGQMEQFKPQIKLVEVNKLFDYLQQFFSSAENVVIHFNHVPGLMVSTDEHYLQTIMHNLTSNAIKALKSTPNAVIEWNAKQQGDKILLSVTDNGPGVKEEQLKALFDDSAVVNIKTGFGLHIIRDLAKAIQCKVSMQSLPGEGTTFILAA